jgi:hypothetical protein
MSFLWLTVFLDFPASDFEPGVIFWRTVTGSGLSASRGATGQFATLLPRDGDPYLRVQRVAAGDGGCHLDLHVDTAVASLAEVAARATALGARPQHIEDGLIVAESPGGFTFCLVSWDGEHAVPSPTPTPSPTLTPGAAGGGASRVDTLCMDVPPDGFEREAAFWAALTGWEARPTPFPEYRLLRTPAELPIRMLVQRLADAAAGQRVRAHVDVGCLDAGAVAAHVALGARVIAGQQYWTVLADPAGREYCLVNREPFGR